VQDLALTGPSRLHGTSIWKCRWRVCYDLGLKLPTGYRDWRVISVAPGRQQQRSAPFGKHAGDPGYSEGKIPFPDGAIIARLLGLRPIRGKQTKSSGEDQVFVAGPPIHRFVHVKDSKKIAATGGWGFASIHGRQTAEEALAQNMLSCHEPAKVGDFGFTHYAP